MKKIGLALFSLLAMAGIGFGASAVANNGPVAAYAEVETVDSSAVADEESAKEEKDIMGEIFNVQNVIAIVSYVLDGGILIAVIRYFIKDKKLEMKVENATRDVVAKLVPAQVKESVLASCEEVFAPLFKQVLADSAVTQQCMSVFSKCVALMQENTPESRKAIIDELSTLGISNKTTLEDVKKYIDETVKAHDELMRKEMEALKQISSRVKENIPEKEEKILDYEEQCQVFDDGVQIG